MIDGSGTGRLIGHGAPQDRVHPVLGQRCCCWRTWAPTTWGPALLPAAAFTVRCPSDVGQLPVAAWHRRPGPRRGSDATGPMPFDRQDPHPASHLLRGAGAFDGSWNLSGLTSTADGSRGPEGCAAQHDAPFVVGLLRNPQATLLICLMTRSQPSALAFVTPSSRNPSISGHHFSIVPARRVVSGMSAVTQAARKRVLGCAGLVPAVAVRAVRREQLPQQFLAGPGRVDLACRT
jgi:hypothetical protein